MYFFIKWKYRIFPRNHQVHWPYRCCHIFSFSPISLVDTDIISSLFQQYIETRISCLFPVAVISTKTASPLLFLTPPFLQLNTKLSAFQWIPSWKPNFCWSHSLGYGLWLSCNLPVVFHASFMLLVGSDLSFHPFPRALLHILPVFAW